MPLIRMFAKKKKEEDEARATARIQSKSKLTTFNF